MEYVILFSTSNIKYRATIFYHFSVYWCVCCLIYLCVPKTTVLSFTKKGSVRYSHWHKYHIVSYKSKLWMSPSTVPLLSLFQQSSFTSYTCQLICEGLFWNPSVTYFGYVFFLYRFIHFCMLCYRININYCWGPVSFNMPFHWSWKFQFWWCQLSDVALLLSILVL